MDGLAVRALASEFARVGHAEILAPDFWSLVDFSTTEVFHTILL
jgi:hypothetical protein